jgi:hypothetical protein
VEAILNVMFKRKLKTADGLPSDLRGQFNALVRPELPVLLLARVMLTTRIVYLFAVDRAWVTQCLAPFFDWNRSEDEALALWQAYAHHPQINAELWAVLEPYFFDTFVDTRLAKFDGRLAGNLATVLMAVGLELPQSATSVDKARGAIRAMAPETRSEAVNWMTSYLQRSQRDAAVSNADEETRADYLWRERVLPWIERVWPRERRFVDQQTAGQYAMLAIATQKRFAEAVSSLASFIIPIEYWGYALNSLSDSTHPDNNPESSLHLLSLLMTKEDAPRVMDFRSLLDRIAAADPTLSEDHRFRNFDDALRAQGR